MSAKWQRSKAWDDRFFPRWAWPAKFALRTLSGIPLAVCLLSLVALYGVLASVPIGMIALIPTYLIYAATLLVAVGLGAALPALVISRLWKGRRETRFAATLIVCIVTALGAALVWKAAVWPALRWDPVHDTGLRLFPEFCAANAATTLRRLPALEMSELEFYSWWPLRVILILFVLNMVMATVRRIEFIFPNIGVLMVHTGIVTLALGSLHYSALKEEGDTALFAGRSPGEPGPPEGAFFDNTRVALWATQRGDGAWEQRPLEGVPRYNDYGVAWSDRALDRPAPESPDGFVDPDIRFRLVGYASYANLQTAWVPAPEGEGAPSSPLVDVELISAVDAAGAAAPERVVAEMRLCAGDPASRTAALAGALAVEHVPAAQAERWAALTMQMPAHADHALVIAVPGSQAPAPVCIVVQPGKTAEVGGWRILVKALSPTPPFPIITPGYEGATSSVAVLEITPPGGAPFDRYVYHRFPELDQDITGAHDGGRPIRRPADPAIRITHIDASALQVYLRSDGPAAVRAPGGRLALISDAPEGGSILIAPGVRVRIVKRWPAAVRQELPALVAESSRQRDNVGNHNAACLAVEVSLPSGWRRTTWLPFARYMGLGAGLERTVALPDGRAVTLAFSRLRRGLPDIALQLVDFEMIPYPHSDIPRDYASELRVTDMSSGEPYTHVTRLNSPLIHRARFHWRDDRSAPANLLAGAISLVAPNQYKFSQAGWDADGWRQTLAEVKAGRMDRPRASFTILGVGNNPGIYIIAAGGVLISVGIPWAFYVKPWIVRRRKRSMQAAAEQRARERRPAPGVEAATA